MRRLRYSVASSLDGFIAGPNGEYDWIPMDPDIDFAAMFAEFGTIVMGRVSWDVTRTSPMAKFDMPVFVYSRTLPEGEQGGVTVVRDGVAHARSLKQGAGKDIWLWGGGVLFRELATAGLVDAVTVAIVPVVLGEGVPLMAPPATRLTLRLTGQRTYPKTGTLLLDYDVISSSV